jgi:sulfite reductase beta subunit-like hemoprotein
MSVDFKKLRLFGVYQQKNPEELMLRVKIPGGLLATEQAHAIATISTSFSNGHLHLTSRGSIEFHKLKLEHLDDIFDRLNTVGLTTRGACGGAVRGIACNTTFSPGYGLAQHLAERLNRHFAGNPEFEGLPKKFKVAVETNYDKGHHLIQDFGIVMVGTSDTPLYDIWCGGGLGREPQASFLLEQKVPEHRLLPLLEAVVQVYRDNTPPPKRLKYLLNNIGETEFRRLLSLELKQHLNAELPQIDRSPLDAEAKFIDIPLFGGQLEATQLHKLAQLAERFCHSRLATTTNQNIALPVTDQSLTAALKSALENSGFDLHDSFASRLRMCPGNHECKMGLTATRQLGAVIQKSLPVAAQANSWAISGCPNSCSQPQLAAYGIVTTKLEKTETGERIPLFDLYQRRDGALGKRIAEKITETELLTIVRDLA